MSYGGENGFSQAIELAADCLMNVKVITIALLLCSRDSTLHFPLNSSFTKSGYYLIILVKFRGTQVRY